MNDKLSEAASIYLQEFPILEHAREELGHQLDDIWSTVMEKIKGDFDEQINDPWSHPYDKGEYALSAKKRGKQDVRFGIQILDPRLSEKPNCYVVKLRCSNDSRKELKNMGAQEPLKKLAEQKGVKQIDWKQRNVWTEEIKLEVNDLQETVDRLGEVLAKLIETVVEFENWIAKQASRSK